MTGVFIRERDWKFGHRDRDTTQREDGIVKPEKNWSDGPTSQGMPKIVGNH